MVLLKSSMLTWRRHRIDRRVGQALDSAPNVVVVPFFIADGLHSFQDIPVLLGIAADEGVAASQSDVFRNNPYHARERTTLLQQRHRH